MKGSSSLLIVGGADEHLLVSKEVRMREKLTQSLVDTMIIVRFFFYEPSTKVIETLCDKEALSQRR